MDEMNFDWDDLRLFLEVARGGGLAAATQRTGKSAPTLGRRMLRLERRLGRELFRRGARGYELTTDGEILLKQAGDLEAHIAPIMQRGSKNRGPTVKISAGTWVTELLCGRAQEILGSDNMRLHFISAEALLDIARREAIIGVRNQRPDNVALAGRKIGTIRFAGYAVDETVKRWAQVMGTTPSAKWVRAQSGHSQAIEVSSPHSALDLARSGVARAVLPTFIGDRQEGLKRVTLVIDELEHEQWLVTHHDDRHIPVVRRVLERVTSILKHNCRD